MEAKVDAITATVISTQTEQAYISTTYHLTDWPHEWMVMSSEKWAECSIDQTLKIR
jgi:hypothetical protein